MDGISIGQAERTIGIRASAIRYYESEGILPRPERVSGIRRYHAKELNRLGLIKLLCGLGFNIAELKSTLSSESGVSGEVTPWKKVVASRLAETDAEIERLQSIRSQLARALSQTCEDPDRCVTLSTESAGRYHIAGRDNIAGHHDIAAPGNVGASTNMARPEIAFSCMQQEHGT